MKLENLHKRFKKMNADISLTNEKNRSFASRNAPYTIDVNGGVFIVNSADETLDINILDEDMKDRHILLNVSRKEPNVKGGGHTVINEKWLCGHDERDWFVGAIKGGVKNIWEAKQSLKPKEVLVAEALLKGKNKQKRKNKARLRQGEWFFLPKPDLVVADYLIHKDEPISRGAGSKPHIVEEVYRSGGTNVWVKGGNIFSQSEYESSANKHLFTQRVADATVYGRGYVKHKDHATIYLDGWHQILMNDERRSANLRFLD